MDRRSDILARVRSSAARANRYADAFLALEHKDQGTVYPILMGYIQDRFLLPPELCTSDNILDLADISLRHILELKKRGLYQGDTSRACSGVSSVFAKKVLLMKAVQQDFGVTMTPEQSAQLSTVTELVNYICATCPSPPSPC